MSSPTAPQLLQYLDSVLEPQRFEDVAPNGWQVQGSDKPIARVVCGVTASLALIEAAIAQQANAVLVHHGLFWRGQSPCVRGWLHQRLKALLTHGIHLFAYHLPLDAHPVWGNNAQLGQRLGWLKHGETLQGHFGRQQLGCLAQATYPNAQAVADHLSQVLGLASSNPSASSGTGPEANLKGKRAPIVVGPKDRPIARVAWCSGGAKGEFEAAMAAGADVYVTGEISEPQMHLAEESGVAFIACGHHASERYGVQALGTHLAEHFGLECAFVDIPNPA